MPLPRPRFFLALPLLFWLAACDQIAVLDGTKAREADALAVGSACRHSGRALEDCFAMYPASPKAQIFTGWKEMNDYMTENKIGVVSPTLVKNDSKADKKVDKTEKAEARPQGLPPTSTAAVDPLAGTAKPGAPPLGTPPLGIQGLEAVATKPTSQTQAPRH